MVRLSTLAENLTAETAFTVLALARSLKAQGKDVVELEIGDSPFPSTPHAKAAGIRAIEENQTGYCPSLGLPEFRAAAARFVSAEFGDRRGGRERRGRLGGEAVRAVLRRGAARPRRRRPGLQPALPDLRPQPRAPGRPRGARAASGRERVPAPRRATSRDFLATDPQPRGDLPELAAQPDRRRRHQRRPGRDRRRGAGDRPDGLLRRALLPHGLGGPARVDPGPAGDARPRGGGLHLQQVVQHERLADRVRGGASRGGRGDRQADQHHGLVQPAVRPVGRAGRARARRADPRRVHGAVPPQGRAARRRPGAGSTASRSSRRPGRSTSSPTSARSATAWASPRTAWRSTCSKGPTTRSASPAWAASASATPAAASSASAAPSPTSGSSRPSPSFPRRSTAAIASASSSPPILSSSSPPLTSEP